MRSPARRRAAAALVGALLVLSAACTSEGEGSEPPVAPSPQAAPDERLDVLMADTPQMADLQTLTADGFTADTGIEVEYHVMPADEVREEIARELPGPGGRYDVVAVTDPEVPIYAENGWLAPLDGVVADPDFAREDVFPSILQGLTGRDGKVYGAPFYGESSFVMYRTDVFEDLGLTMPERPTWPEIAELAHRADQARAGMSGICLRGKPGWDQLVEPLTTVVNTFGGTWFEQDWTPRLNAPEFTRATDFYVDLLREEGPDDASEMGYEECLVAVQQGKAAIWYDATSAAASLESLESPVKGKMGYVQAPVVSTESSGWLHSWAWSMVRGTTDAEAAAQFVTWASSQEYEQLAGAEMGWARVPAGKRASTYRNEEYLEDAGAFALPTERAIMAADPRNPGLQPRPTAGIQYVDIPEFTDLGQAVSEDVSRAIDRKTTVEAALRRGQAVAEQIADTYRGTR